MALAPGSTIGILGGGQLGRMLAVAAAEMGYHVHVFTLENDSPASHVAAHTTVAEYTDTAALEAFAKSVDVITYEFENIPLAGVAALEKHNTVSPSADVLSICQHRVTEKTFVRSLGIGTAPFAPATTLDALKKAAGETGFPCVIKTCRLGYDGKGQVMVKSAADLESAWAQLKTDDAIVEGFVDFAMEASVIVARSGTGEIATYPLVENIHRHHILHETIVPARVDAKVAAEAEKIARKIAEALTLVGVLAVEMFITKDGKILVNELAPRPHNSGHWSIDACVTSQFEQTVRAVCSLPLGSVARLADAVMTNLIGDEINAWRGYMSDPTTKVHIYGKREARPGRKMGHVTRLLLR